MEPVLSPRASLSIVWEFLAEGDALLRLRGELELYTVASLRSSVQAHSHKVVGRLVLDLSGLQFLDSAGISAIISLYKRFRPEHEVCLVPPGGLCGELMDRMRITRFLPVFRSTAAALSANPHRAGELPAELADGTDDTEASGFPQVA